MGRKANGSNKGFFYRKGRGWTVSGTSILLADPSTGARLKDRRIGEATLREAYVLYRQTLAAMPKEQPGTDNAVRLGEIITAFLDAIKRENAASTVEVRRRFLYDLATGLPAEYIEMTPEVIAKIAKKGELRRIHAGHANTLLCNFTKNDVVKWCDAHSEWEKGSRRMAIQAIKRCLNWAVTQGLPGVVFNPIKGLPAGKPKKKVSYFTPELEKAMIEQSLPDFALALKVLIRTGARYMCEFAALTAEHVQNIGPGRQQWVWTDGTKVRGKKRVIRITDQEIIDTVNQFCKLYPDGPIFRSMSGKPWTADAMKKRWERLKKSLMAKGCKFKPQDSLYSCRHTFAKRTLGGYYNGKQVTIETLCGLMGNSRQVCWENYADWCDLYTEPLWEALA